MTARILTRGVLFLALVVVAFSQTEPWDPVTFDAGGRSYRLVVRCVRTGSFIVLSDGKRETVLGGAGGNNLFPKVQVSEDRFHVLWVNYQDGHAGLGLYDSATRASRVVPLDGLKFAGSPALVERAGRPLGVVLLGNASDNDDVFFLDLRTRRLENITRTPRSEKGFTIETGTWGTLVRTETLADRARYVMGLDGAAKFRLLGRESRPVPERQRSKAVPDAQDCRPANTYAAFGDSITFGVMRMENLEGEEHPELAYPERIREILATFYGPAFPVNLGVPAQQTYQGALRVHQDLSGVDGLYFLLMMGTNDVIHGYFSIDSSIESLDYIIAAAEERGMRIIVSTIPPRKDSFGEVPWVLNNIAELNLGISELAESKGIGFIDTHGVFMATHPPDGWKALMEDIGGNHPSPAGHTIIATLFADRLAAFPPREPKNVTRIAPEGPGIRRFGWDPVCESDLAWYRIEYGAIPSSLEGLITTNASTVVFPGFPSHDVYFRVQSVDAAGYRSGFTRIHSTVEKPRTRRGHSLSETERLASGPAPSGESLTIGRSGGLIEVHEKP